MQGDCQVTMLMQYAVKLPGLAGPAPVACGQPYCSWQAAAAMQSLGPATACSALAEPVPHYTSAQAHAAH